MNDRTTPEQFRDEMQKISEEIGEDEEMAHIQMDGVLCRVLAELGYSEGVAIFDEQGKWYA